MKVNKAKSFKVWESFSSGQLGLRYPKQISLTEDDKDEIRNLKWEDLDWKRIGDDGNNVIWLSLITPDGLDEGITVDIQLIADTLYQIHIDMAQDLQGLGLGYKIYVSLVKWAGHLYSGKKRRQNPIINKVWDRLKNESGVECATNDLGDICVSNEHPNKEELLSMFNRI